ncbi:hypothetical protein D3C85_1743270 [compost metagenome]
MAWAFFSPMPLSAASSTALAVLRLILPTSLALATVVAGLVSGLSAASTGWLSRGRQPSSKAAIRVFLFMVSRPCVVPNGYKKLVELRHFLSVSSDTA